MQYIIAIFGPISILSCIIFLAVAIEPLGLILGCLFYGAVVLYGLLVVWTILHCLLSLLFQVISNRGFKYE